MRFLPLFILILIFPCAETEASEPVPLATRIVQKAKEDCNRFENGEFHATENAMTWHDITGDGQPEAFVDAAQFSCSTALTLWAGTGGTYLWVIVEGDAYEFLAHNWRLVDFDGQQVLLLAVHSSQCSDDIGPCYRAMVWQQGFRSLR